MTDPTPAEALKLPRLTEAMIQAACDGHFGRGHNIDGLDLTVNGRNWTFREGFQRMWSNMRKHLNAQSPKTPSPPDAGEVLKAVTRLVLECRGPLMPDMYYQRRAEAIVALFAGEVRTYRDGVSSEWQEIETAPKDGTDVLLFTDTRASDSVSMRIYLHTGGEHFTAVQIGFWEDAVDAPMRKERAGWRKDKIGEPTHWMPMPTPPAAAIRKLP